MSRFFRVVSHIFTPLTHCSYHKSSKPRHHRKMESSLSLSRKKSRSQLLRATSFQQQSMSAEVSNLFDELSEHERFLGLPDIERLSTRRVLGRDSSSQIRTLTMILESIKSASTKFAHIGHLCETRILLADPSVLDASTSANLLRQNVIQIHEAVEELRSVLSQPLPILVKGNMILFDLLEEPRVQADIKAQVHSNTALSAVGVRSLAAVTPYSNVQFRPKVKDLPAKSAALTMLPSCGHFPFALSSEDASSGSGASLPDRETVAAYQRALTFLRYEYQRQVSFCRKRVDLVKQQKYQPLLEFSHRLLGIFDIPQHLWANEERSCVQVFREVSRLYSETERRELFIFEANLTRPQLNVRSLLSSSFAPVPSYLIAIPESGISREKQLMMISASLHMKRCYDSWIRFADSGKRKRAAIALEQKIRSAFVRSRFLCWYRFLAARMVSSVSSKGRRKSMRRQSTVISADTEPSLPMSPHFSRIPGDSILSGSGAHTASVLSFVENRPATASAEVQAGGRTGGLLIRNTTLQSKRRGV